MRLPVFILGTILTMFAAACSLADVLPSQPSRLSQEILQLRYQGVRPAFAQEQPTTPLTDNPTSSMPRPLNGMKRKSAAKAFVMSLLIPGLGQLYYGSPVKAIVFFGADIAFWASASSYHNKGNQLTDQFNAFNLAHWHRQDYQYKYLLWTYGDTTDKNIQQEEISHHLPDTETQQYFEMTGKYNQFAWGWDDAQLNGKKIDDYSSENKPPRILDTTTTPYSAHRWAYVEMRHVANTKFDRSRAMIMLAIANRVISGFEALFAVDRHNRALPSDKQFSTIDVRASLKSYYSSHDTPFLNCTYRFR